MSGERFLGLGRNGTEGDEEAVMRTLQTLEEVGRTAVERKEVRKADGVNEETKAIVRKKGVELCEEERGTAGEQKLRRWMRG